MDGEYETSPGTRDGCERHQFKTVTSSEAWAANIAIEWLPYSELQAVLYLI